MTDTKTIAPEGIKILALRAGLTVPLAGPLDHMGIGTSKVLDRGDEAVATAAWVTEHDASPSFIRAEDPDAEEHRRLILLEQRELESAAAQVRRLEARRYGKPIHVRDSQVFQDALDAELRSLGIAATD